MTAKFQLPRNLQSFCEVRHPADAVVPILIRPVRDAVHEWMTEINMRTALESVNIEPRNTALLYGPPGCGKTTLAHHFAARLGMSLISVKMDSIVSSYVGKTENHIGELFSTIKNAEVPAVLFLDEFDAIATSRTSDGSSAGKGKDAVVNALLVRIEEHKGICIAATNRGDAIDPALWRRFGLHLDIGLPGQEERFAILNKYLFPYALPEKDIDTLAEEMAGASPALIKQVMEGIKRSLILNPCLNRPIDANTILGQVLASVKPHAAYATPPLWESLTDILPAISWPPQPCPKAA
ncbi:MAG: AAA family ATPase [Alphaproteobacteria bacterium]|nr:MAG: AAA family ATPase [Alphaproteobacteria bacterium]